jgi:hypothetical protein
MMKYLMHKTKLVAILAITVLLVVLGILNLRDRLATPSVADDGVEWINTANGVQAKSVRSDAQIAVKKGDYLRAIFYQANMKRSIMPRPFPSTCMNRGSATMRVMSSSARTPGCSPYTSWSRRSTTSISKSPPCRKI